MVASSGSSVDVVRETPVAGHDIAVVGMACRFAEARDTAEFWANLLSGRECFSEIPADRWDNRLIYSEQGRDIDKSYVARGGFIDDVRDFAAMHFGIAPRRVQVMDPQHRLLLDTVRVALQDAGYERSLATPSSTPPRFNPQRTGTFLGLSTSEYRDILGTRSAAIEMVAGGLGRAPQSREETEAILDAVERIAPISAFSMPGTLLNMAAANVAHQWGLGGPAYSIDAACASALVAVYDAVVYLRNGLCDAAVAGGVYLNLTPVNLISFSRIGAISKQGRCRPFDAEADGFLQGDGCGIVVLKRLEDAVRDGDRVHAVIRGVGINNDGPSSPGPMAPSPDGQLEAIELALRDSGVDPATIGLVECHGTATLVGDPVEVGSIRAALARHAAADQTIWLSSVKANIGHTMSAAGIAGLIKAILALEHGTIPPQAAFETPNPKLELESGPFAIARSATPWVRRDAPLRAGVSSFGFGGTNCHMVLEEAPAMASRDQQVTVAAGEEAPTFLVALSAPSGRLLATHARHVAAEVEAGEARQARLVDLAYTLSATRRVERARLALVVRTHEELVRGLRQAADALDAGPVSGKLGADVFVGDVVPGSEAPPLAFMFQGQGAQRVGLLAALRARVPRFRAELEQLGAACDGMLDRALLDYLYPELDGNPGTAAAAEEALQATEVCQPAMAALGLGLHGLLGEMGLRPRVTLGHSLGEFVAAAAGGMLGAAECVRFVARRGRFMADLRCEDFGAMAAVMADRRTVEEHLGGLEGVAVANINHARQTVISGGTAAVSAAVEALKEARIAAKPLRVSHAFHSSIVAPVAGLLAGAVAELTVSPGDAAVVSAITGEAYADVDSARRTFVEHTTAPVDFVSALQKAWDLGARVFLEVGAGKTLSTFAKAVLSDDAVVVQLAGGQADGDATFHRALALLATMGHAPSLSVLFDGYACRPVSLPPTPLEKEAYWAVQDRQVKVRPSGLNLEALPAFTAPGASAGTPADADLVALFRQQAEILRTHAEILAQQTAMLSGRAVMGAEPAPLDRSAVPVPPPVPVVGAPVTSSAAVEVPAPDATPAAATKLPAAVDVGAKVFDAVALVSAFPRDALRLDQVFASDLGFDSLMFVELGTKIEAAFPELSAGIPQSLLSERTTIADIVSYLESQVGGHEGAVAVAAVPSKARALRLYAPALVDRRRSTQPGAPSLGQRVLVTSGPQAITDALVERLAAGREVVLVRLGSAYRGVERDGAIARLDWSAEPDAIEGLFETLSTGELLPDSVLHVAGMSSELAWSAVLAGSPLPEPVAVAQQLAACAQRALGGKPPGVFAVLTGQGGDLGLEGFDRTGASVWQGGLVGFARALAREWPASLVKLVDLDSSAAGDAAADAVLAELASPDVAVDVAIRDAQRRTVQLVELEEPLRASFDGVGAQDVVVVTGGGRGLGASLARHLAESTRCSLVIVGSSPLDDAPQVREQLAQMQSAGAPIAYVRWDVRSAAPAELQQAIAKLGGKVTGVVHAAGVLRDRRVADKSVDDLRTVFAVKVDGLVNVLRAVGTESLRFVVGVSSWAAHYGNVGQTDYAAANEQLDRLVALLGRLHPGMRAVSMLWPPWEDSDMARSIPSIVKKAMISEGVPFLTVSEGLAAFDRALLLGASPEVLVGVDNPLAVWQVRSSTTLSLASHPYLGDHRLQGKAVLPMAGAMDYVGAAALDLQEGAWPVVIEDMELFAGVSADEPVQLHVETRSVRTRAEATTRVELRVGSGGAEPALAWRARLGTLSPLAPIQIPDASQARTTELPFSLDAFYAERTFHGPRLRAVTRVEELGTEHVVGTVRTSRPDALITQPPRAEWVVDPVAVDGGFQLVAYWLAAVHDLAAYPVGFERFVQYRPFGGSEVRCTVVRSPSDEGTFVGSIRFDDPASGVRLAELHNVRARVLEGLRREATGGTNGRSKPTVARAAEAGLSVSTKAANIDEKFWKVEAFPEVKELRQRLQMAELMGIRNPFFPVHSGTARDTSVVEGREMINFSSYNYLGFSGHPMVAEAAKAAIDRYGTSVSASRVASGERPLHRDLEAGLARVVGTEAALAFSAGHMTNESVIGHMFGDGDLIVHDALAHNSVQMGAIMSGARRRPFPHNDHAALDALLTQLRPNFQKCCIVLEGVYSMDGDIPALPRFMELRDKHRCLLFVDEAHSIGVLGARGGGIGEHFGVDRSRVDFWMGTLSKAFSSCGGYIAGSKSLVEYLKYTTPAFVFSAGISPANAAAALAAIELMEARPEVVARLQENSRMFLTLARARGIHTGLSHDSAVVPCIVGNSFKCLQLSERLAERGINVQPIVYPAVDDDAARLRFFLSALHTEPQLRHTVDVLAEELAALGIPPLPDTDSTPARAE